MKKGFDVPASHDLHARQHRPIDRRPACGVHLSGMRILGHVTNDLGLSVTGF
jgi:hypothetical protein